MRKCKNCGAEIKFIRTVAGKMMPCNAQPVTYWEKLGCKGRIVTSNGEVLSCEFEGNFKDATGVGYIPHFATCPNVDRYRRRK